MHFLLLFYLGGRLIERPKYASDKGLFRLCKCNDANCTRLTEIFRSPLEKNNIGPNRGGSRCVKENSRSNSVLKYEFPRFNRHTACLSRLCAKISHAFVDLQNTYVLAIITCSDFSLVRHWFRSLAIPRFPNWVISVRTFAHSSQL